MGEKLAIELIQKDAERAAAAVALVEKKIENGELKTSSAGYLKVVFESGAVISTDLLKGQRAKAAAQRRDAELQATRQQHAAEDADAARVKARNAAVKALTAAQRAAYLQTYLRGEGKGAKSYDREAGKFRNTVERIAFDTWLRTQVTA
jgi:hypothetical protein